jgi:hypothetical protein
VGLTSRRAVISLLWVTGSTLCAPAQDLATLGEPPRAFDLVETVIAPPPARTGAGLSVDRHSRAAVASFYNTIYAASQGVPANWTGDVSTCDAGDTAAAYQEAIARRVNLYRAMCGLPGDVTLAADLHPKCQQAAEMMIAEGNLSHSPPPSWACYTADGAQAAGKSNLALGSHGPTSIDRYMQDSGGNNTAVGHRRWILYPRQVTMGTGDTTGTNGYYHGSNDLWVIGTSGARPAEPEFVAWPPDGFVPYQLVWARWSFSLNTASSVSFSGATVSMRCGGDPVSLTQHPIANGYGDNTIVWEPQGLSGGAPSHDTAFTITVSNVAVAGTPRDFAYTVTVFDPATDPDPTPDGIFLH